MGRADAVERLDAEDVLALDEETLDPTKHYRFVHPRNMARRKSQGYEIVLRSETGIKLRSDQEALKSADDHVRVGNTILMACTKERFDERRKKQQALGRARLKSSEEQFANRARKRGVPFVTE